MHPRDLADHIECTFHARARASIPRITNRLYETRVDAGLIRAWEALAGSLALHMDLEDRVFFPSVIAMFEGGMPVIEDFEGAVVVMEEDHAHLRDLTAAIRRLSHLAGPVRSELAWFVAELVEHIEIEESELFPRVLELHEALVAVR